MFDSSELVTVSRNDDDVGNVGEQVEERSSLCLGSNPGVYLAVWSAPHSRKGDRRDNKLEGCGGVSLAFGRRQ